MGSEEVSSGWNLPLLPLVYLFRKMASSKTRVKMVEVRSDPFSPWATQSEIQLHYCYSLRPYWDLFSVGDYPNPFGIPWAHDPRMYGVNMCNPLKNLQELVHHVGLSWLIPVLVWSGTLTKLYLGHIGTQLKSWKPPTEVSRVCKSLLRNRQTLGYLYLLNVHQVCL